MGEAKDTGQSPRVPGGVRRGRQEARGGAQSQGGTAHAHRGIRWSAGGGSRQASVSRVFSGVPRLTVCRSMRKFQKKGNSVAKLVSSLARDDRTTSL